MRTSIARICAALLLCFATSVSGEARPFRGGGAERFGPLRLKIYGYVGEKPEGVPPLTTWVLTAGGKNYTFICDKIDVLNGNAGYMDIVSALEPYKPAFRLNGGKRTIEPFVTSAPKQRLVMLGVLTFGGSARIFMLDSITPLPEPTPNR